MNITNLIKKLKEEHDETKLLIKIVS